MDIAFYICKGFGVLMQAHQIHSAMDAASADSSMYCLQGFSLKTLKHLVLDEADRLLNMDFEQEIDQILKVGALPLQHQDSSQ